ncbi:hypothetical protein Droror1_Dr00001221 [Drosera rotundifolia]
MEGGAAAVLGGCAVLTDWWWLGFWVRWRMGRMRGCGFDKDCSFLAFGCFTLEDGLLAADVDVEMDYGY